MEPLSLDQAAHIVDAALARGRELDLHPLTVAVLDHGGALVACKRENGSGLLRPDIAQAKAWGVLGMGLGGRALAARAATAPAFFDALTAISGGRIAPVPGGVLIRDAERHVLGAVGISGDTSDNDEICALAAVESAGLTPDAG
ncbi:heme-binding protein [Streptomyces sp. NPDC056161]|uniref:GlcG/HbpS family heme-binding protein n=1 Tax=Streptomyces sp. NPDC056161 TaxID=3345732 RepID=UPI0035E31851